MKESYGIQLQGGMDVQSTVNQLKVLGYRIQGPKTLDEIEAEMNVKIDNAVKEGEKNATEKLQSDEKKMKLLTDLGGALIEGLMPAVAETTVGKALGVASVALKAAKNAET